jgi:hypothetical protein
MKNFVVSKLFGRCGNQFYQIATGLAHAKRENLDFYTTTAENATNYFNTFPKKEVGGKIYEEKINVHNNPFYSEIPSKMGNCMLIGYWQSFKYFDDYKVEILSEFNLPYNLIKAVSIHVRRGDYLIHSELFPPLPIKYYNKAISFFNEKGYYNFHVFSDDIEYCKTIFEDGNSTFTFIEGNTELEDLSLMSSCEHNIVANSSFSMAASWFNQNENKIVVCPYKMFTGANEDMIPNNYIKIKY